MEPGFKASCFKEFAIAGLIYLDPAHPRGEFSIQFGCPFQTAAGARRGPGSNPVATDPMTAQRAAVRHGAGPLAARPAAARRCQRVHQRGHHRALRRRSARPVHGHRAAAHGQPSEAPTCPQLAARPVNRVLGLPLAVTMRLGRALLEVRAYDDEGDEQRYACTIAAMCWSAPTVAVRAGASADGQPAAGLNQAASNERPASDGHDDTSGQASLRGLLSPDDTDLRVLGQIRLELFESLLRASFRHAHGDATVDVALRGKPSDLRLLGRIEIKDSRFIPNAIDTPVEVKRGVLDLTAGRATLHTLNAVVDGAETQASGTIDIQSLSPALWQHRFPAARRSVGSAAAVAVCAQPGGSARSLGAA